MKTRTRRPTEEFTPSFLDELGSNVDLESLSDEELETLLFQEEPEQPSGFWNLPTLAGLSLIVVGVAYIFQEMGMWNGFDVSVWAEMLPWLAGILIILLGFGVLSWRPKRRQKRAERVKAEKKRVEKKSKSHGKRRVVRSRDKKIAGVCGGIAEYFSVDPTLVRIAFVIGTIASGGPFLLAYIILAFIMPKPEEVAAEERIRIIRDY